MSLIDPAIVAALTEGRLASEDDMRPCRGTNTNVCVAEGCYGESCLEDR